MSDWIPIDIEKRAERHRLLAAHPEARIVIQPAPLQALVPQMIEFRCFPECSVARNQAIQGSDIDGAVVLVNEPVSEPQQRAFVAELQRQGFAAVTDGQHKEVCVLYEQKRQKARQLPYRQALQIMDEYGRQVDTTRETRVIFMTPPEVEQYGRMPDDERHKLFVAHAPDYHPPDRLNVYSVARTGHIIVKV